jgi:hypothetical protein
VESHPSKSAKGGAPGLGECHEVQWPVEGEVLRLRGAIAIAMALLRAG